MSKVWKQKSVLSVLKKLVTSAAIFAMMASLMGCYTIKQAVVFNNMYNSRLPIQKAAKDMKLSDQERKNLLKIPAILAFASQRGLNTEGAYNYYIRMNESVVSYSLQAARPLQMEFETWWFPIVGRVPYLGFFSKQERDQKAAELENSGFDVNLSGVAAFSSLGWFDDPIYTSMVADDEIEVVHLLLHELTHRTFWSSGSVEFNENLAEFVSGILTADFYKSRPSSDQLKSYLERREENRRFKLWLMAVRKKLETIYTDGSLSDDVKLLQKKQIIATAVGPDFPIFQSKNYQKLKEKSWNNAAILAHTLYLPATEIFERAFACFGRENVGEFLIQLKEFEKTFEDSFKALDHFCTSKS